MKGGKKHKRGRKLRAPRTLVIKDQNTAYAKVLSNLGNGLCSLQIISNQGDEDQCIGHIRGKVVRVRFNKGDIVLIGFREITKEISDKKALEVDINYKYYPDQVQQLERMGEIKKQNDYTGFEFADDVEFDYDDEQSSESEDGDNIVCHSKVDYSNPMPDYKSDDDVDLEEDIEYDKFGNTIVKPKKVETQLQSSLADGQHSDSESDSDKSPVKFERKLTKAEKKKLESMGNTSQGKKMATKMQRDKKMQDTSELLDVDYGEININDI
jgi:translation initiation factor IF-1